jgi:hypothetical protein
VREDSKKFVVQPVRRSCFLVQMGILQRDRGLFFGHSQVGVFTEQHERLAVGVATWAPTPSPCGRSPAPRRSDLLGTRDSTASAGVAGGRRSSESELEIGEDCVHARRVDGGSRLSAWSTSAVRRRFCTERLHESPQPASVITAPGIVRRRCWSVRTGDSVISVTYEPPTVDRVVDHRHR